MRSKKGKVKLDITALERHLQKLARRIDALRQEYGQTEQLRNSLVDAVKEKTSV